MLDPDGNVLPAVHEVLDLAAEHGAIVTGGHLAAEVIDVLFAAARRHGVERLLVNHPQYIVGATPEHCRSWARTGVVIEHSVGMYHDSFGRKPARYPLSDLLAYIEAAGPGASALVSDTGMSGYLRPVDTIRAIASIVFRNGRAPELVRALVGGNAAVLLAR